jgi:hypothetical protein
VDNWEEDFNRGLTAMNADEIEEQRRGGMTEMPKSFLRSNGGRMAWLWRFVAATVTVGSALGLYYAITLRHSVASAIVVMPGWVPFWPVFAVPYFGMLLLAWLLPVAIRDPGRFRACLLAMACAFLLIVPLWILIPTRLERPPMPEGWWAGPYLWLAEIDPPNCVLPCGHVIGATAAAWFIRLERPTWRWPLVAMLAVGFVSIAVIGQHRPVDILIGTVATAVGIGVAEVLGKRRRVSG